MSYAIIIALVLILLFSVNKLMSRGASQSTGQQSSSSRTMRCPSCGSPVEIHGSSWECGWCGDFGKLR